MLGEGTLCYKVMLSLYRVCLVRHPGLQNNADSIQGVLGESTLVSWFGVLLVMVTRMCLCAFELIFSWRYQECILVSRFK